MCLPHYLLVASCSKHTKVQALLAFCLDSRERSLVLSGPWSRVPRFQNGRTRLEPRMQTSGLTRSSCDVDAVDTHGRLGVGGVLPRGGGGAAVAA